MNEKTCLGVATSYSDETINLMLQQQQQKQPQGGETNTS
jgi:hypothetical protein